MNVEQSGLVCWDIRQYYYTGLLSTRNVEYADKIARWTDGRYRDAVGVSWLLVVDGGRLDGDAARECCFKGFERRGVEAVVSQEG